MDILPINKQNKLLLFSKYIGTSCTINIDGKEKYSFIEGINWMTQSVLADGDSIDPNNITLILNDLEDATEFDCVMLSCINLESINNIAETHLVAYSKRSINAYLHNNNTGGFIRLWESLSYLQMKNYAIPYIYMENDIVRIASVKNLVDQGLVMYK